MTRDDLQVIERTLATLNPENRAAALRVLDREALRTVPEVSSSGRKKAFLEEPMRRAMDEDVIFPAVQGLTMEHLVSLIKRKEPKVINDEQTLKKEAHHAGSGD